MVSKCVLCDNKIESLYGKMNGTYVKAGDIDGRNKLISVCSSCQKIESWIEKAKIKGA